MLVDKNKLHSPVLPKVNVVVNDDSADNVEVELYETNALCEIYKAVKEILLTITEDPDDPNSPPYFKTIKINNGQFNRIKNSKQNTEYALAFPAIFLHFIDVRYLVSQSRVNEGRGTLRLQFVLNKLNNSDDEVEMEGFKMFQRINRALMDNKTKYPALTERFQLTYFDQLESFDNGLQPYWITYEVWFTDYSTERYRNYKEVYLVVPPFTNHSDQLPDNNKHNHDNHTEPTFEECADFKDFE